VRHEIEPPPSLSSAWRDLMGRKAARLQSDRTAHLDRVATRFTQRVRWWEREFPKGELPPPPPAAPTAAAATGGVATAVQPPRSPAPPAAPAPPRPAALPPPGDAAARERALEAAWAAASAREADSSSRLTADAAARPDTAADAARIRLAPWAPDSPVMRRLRSASDADRYRIYLDERPSHSASTAFFLDVAELFLERGHTALGLRVLSNLAEMQLAHRQILRILAYRLLQAGQVEVAVPLLEQVARLAPDEPQSLRDLGLAHAAAGRQQHAVDLLWQVVSRPWDRRFPDIDMTALAELNAIVGRARASGAAAPDTRAFDDRLMRNLPLALRVVLAWDSDNTDIDLHVIDPNGERCSFERPLTFQGGRLSADFVGGYGPEEFALRDAKPGTYTIQADFFGHRQQVISAHTTLMVKLTTGFGTASQQERDIVVRLSGEGRLLTLGSFEVSPAATPK